MGESEQIRGHVAAVLPSIAVWSVHLASKDVGFPCSFLSRFCQFFFVAFRTALRGLGLGAGQSAQ